MKRGHALVVVPACSVIPTNVLAFLTSEAHAIPQPRRTRRCLGRVVSRSGSAEAVSLGLAPALISFVVAWVPALIWLWYLQETIGYFDT